MVEDVQAVAKELGVELPATYRAAEATEQPDAADSTTKLPPPRATTLERDKELAREWHDNRHLYGTKRKFADEKGMGYDAAKRAIDRGLNALGVEATDDQDIRLAEEWLERGGTKRQFAEEKGMKESTFKKALKRGLDALRLAQAESVKSGN